MNNPANNTNQTQQSQTSGVIHVIQKRDLIEMLKPFEDDAEVVVLDERRRTRIIESCNNSNHPGETNRRRIAIKVFKP